MGRREKHKTRTRGLYLLVDDAHGRWWRFRVQVDGAEKQRYSTSSRRSPPGSKPKMEPMIVLCIVVVIAIVAGVLFMRNRRG